MAKTARKNVKDMTPAEKTVYLRKNASGFAMGIGIITLIAIPLLPLIYHYSYKSVLPDIIVSCCFGALFLAFGILFYKKDSSAFAKVLIVLFIIYAFEKIYELVIAYNFAVIVWIVLAIMQIIYLFQYLQNKKKSDFTTIQVPTPTNQMPPPPPTSPN